MSHDDMDAQSLGRRRCLVLLRDRRRRLGDPADRAPGPEQTPLTAVSLDEWQRAREAADLAEYEKKYGVALAPVPPPRPAP